MPTPAEVRRERRAAVNRVKDPTIYPRRHCRNCNKWFWRVRPNKLFCSVQCSREFKRYGSAFGPLKDYLTKLIETTAGEIVAKRFTTYAQGKDFRRELAAAGFVHKSMLKPKPPEFTPESFHRSILTQGRMFRELELRVQQLEAHAIQSPAPPVRNIPGPGAVGVFNP